MSNNIIAQDIVRAPDSSACKRENELQNREMENEKSKPLMGNEIDQEPKRRNHKHHHHYNQRHLPDFCPQGVREEGDFSSAKPDSSSNNNPVEGQDLSRKEKGELKTTPRPKSISHRSQSSPSSLTTHKFGLRPTPSPPRLIIDHQTGDIIESYPEQPVYLRTYQPLDDSEATTLTSATDNCSPLEVSSLQSYPNSSGKEQFNYYQTSGEPLSEISKLQQVTMSGSNRTSSRSTNIIPPPHSAANANRVYFAPPVSSSGHHLFPNNVSSFNGGREERTINNQHQHQHQLSDEDDHQMVVSTSGSDQSVFRGSRGDRTQSGAHNSSFKRALNRLEYGNHPHLISSNSKTDIAFVTEPHSHAVGSRASQIPSMNITSTAIDKRQQLVQQSKLTNAYEEPPIESFKLYNFWFNLRVILAIVISITIIYLLVRPLNTDCLSYRPTYTYISIIVSFVNLTCITVFSLFWFCNGVTRALYANLSSSAFIVTIYSILVAINLALAIMFFFINTCHYQKIAHTRPPFEQAVLITKATAASEFTSTNQPDWRTPEDLINENYNANNHRDTRRVQLQKLGRQHSDLSKSKIIETSYLRAKRQIRADQGDHTLSRLGGLPVIAVAHEDWDHEDDSEFDAHSPITPAMSPIEAAWEYMKEQAQLLKRHFYRFLAQYDLRFIGALHALVAVCLQYLAIRIAVVRSYFCSPVLNYI